jgi:UDP-N-acetylglucosamine acyltransferase
MTSDSPESFTGIHPTAIISRGAELHPSVTVGPWCLIGPHARIGAGTRLHSNVIITGRVTLGQNNEVFPFATIGSKPQDLKYHGEPSEVIIGDRNQIREYVNISPGTEGGGMKTVIGSGNLFMVYTHIAHDCQIGDNNIFANANQIAGHVIIGNHAVLGGASGVHQFCRIGDMAMVAGGSAVAQDVPPYCMVHGDRAKINGLNVVGLRRSDFGAERVGHIKTMYSILYRQELILEDAIARIESDVPETPEKGVFLAFLRSSERGVVR